MISTRELSYLRIAKRKHPYLGNKKPIWNILKADQWRNERCFIIGGGPSLRGFDFNRLENKGRIIAVNKSFYHLPFADVLIAMDVQFFKWANAGELSKGRRGIEYKRAYNRFQGVKIFADLHNSPMNDVYFIKRLGYPKFTKNIKEGIYTGNNSGVTALSFAALMGCNPIYLMGMDGCHSGKKSHFHDGYQSQQHESTAKSFIRHFDLIGKELKKAGFEIYNLSPISKIKIFAKKNIDDILKEI